MSETLQVVTTAGEASTTCDERDLQKQHQQMNLDLDQDQQHYPHQHQVATTAFHVSRPSNAMSAIVTPPLNHTSVVLDDDSFHVSRIIESFQVSIYYLHIFLSS
ncbi:hypothetical protein Hanom_Chr09g00760991 [Helianthus anomalus]